MRAKARTDKRVARAVPTTRFLAILNQRAHLHDPPSLIVTCCQCSPKDEVYAWLRLRVRLRVRVRMAMAKAKAKGKAKAKAKV